MTLISRERLAGLRTFAGRYPDLLEGQAPTLASPRYAASSVGTAIHALTDFCLASSLTEGPIQEGSGLTEWAAWSDRYLSWKHSQATVSRMKAEGCIAGSTVSEAVSCSAAVRRARQHISQQSEGDAWPSATSLLIVPPRLSRGSLVKPLEPLHLGQPSQTASATAGPWK